MSQIATFKVLYDGPALLSHEMNVKDLAPALLAIGELLEDSNKILNGEKAKIAVNIKATDPGSVVITLSAVQNLVTQAVSLFSSNEADALVNAIDILKLLGFASVGGYGVLGLLKWLKNRKIKSIIKLDTGDFQVEAEDGELRMSSNKEIKLFSFLSVRKSIEAVFTPLDRIGIEKVSFIQEDVVNSVTKEERNYLCAPIIDQELIDESEIEQSLQIVNISFQAGGKWRFGDGNATFFAEITDKEFLDKVEQNEMAFAKDDLLKVRLKRKQFISEGSIKTDYIVIKVLDHRSALVQIKLPFKDGII
jgi:hypothetical protein